MPVNYSAADRNAHVELARPDAGNALDLETTHALRDAMRRALGQHDVDIVTLTASGPDFCTGTDTEAARASDDPTTDLFEQAAALDELFSLLHSSTKPVVAGVHGLAAGSGLGLVLAADIALCSPDARFRVAPEGGLGAPDPGLAWLLPRAVGQQRALTFALRRLTLDATQADRWGIATMRDGDLSEAVDEVAADLVGEHLWANGEMRRLLRASWETSRTAISQSEAATLVRAILRPQG